MRRGALNINRETAAGLRAALVGAVPLRRPPLCRAAKAFTRITTGVPRLDSLAAAAAHSHCICTSLIGGAPGGRGRAYAARHRACGPLAVGPQPPRSDAARLALHATAARRCGPRLVALSLSAVLRSRKTLGFRTAPAEAWWALLSATQHAIDVSTSSANTWRPTLD